MFNVCVMCRCKHFAVEHKMYSDDYREAGECRICDCESFQEIEMPVLESDVAPVGVGADEPDVETEEDEEEFTDLSSDEQSFYLKQQLMQDDEAWDIFRLEVKTGRLEWAQNLATLELTQAYTLEGEILHTENIYRKLKDIENEPLETLRQRRYRYVAQHALYWRHKWLKAKKIIRDLRQWWAQ